MIKTETRERIATIELARPDKKNALTAAMYAAMTESLAAAESDPGVRAIVIHETTIPSMTSKSFARNSSNF